MSELEKGIFGVIEKCGYIIVFHKKIKTLTLMHIIHTTEEHGYTARFRKDESGKEVKFFIEFSQPIPESTMYAFKIDDKSSLFELTKENYKEFLMDFLPKSAPVQEDND